MIYLTFKESPSAVYRSQVVGTCEHLQDRFDVETRLVAFFGPRRFLEARRALLEQYSNSLALPAFPRGRHWHRNAWIVRLGLASRPVDGLIARGPIATNLALLLRAQGVVERVCYDGRGAVASEGSEYRHPSDREKIQQRVDLERSAVLQADFRLSVSEQLVRYWREKYGYVGSDHVVVPCALKETALAGPPPDPEERWKTRAALGFGQDDLILAYAGSHAGWQSLDRLTDLLRLWLDRRSDLKVLLLSREHPSITKLAEAFPDQVRRTFVKPEEVHGLLAAADHGLLLREPSETNAVAAPTKFAEYLAAGLGVLISPGLGDYSGFVERHGCGRIVEGAELPVASVSRQSEAQRRRCTELAGRYFVRTSYDDEYERVIDTLRSQRNPSYSRSRVRL